MPAEEIEREIQDAYARLVESVEVVRYCHEHYLDGLIGAHAEQARRADREFARLRAEGQASYEKQVVAAGHVGDEAAGDLSVLMAALMSDNPWALSEFGDMAWDDYEPDSQAPAPDGLRIGVLKVPGRDGLPPVPAVARFAGYGHLLIRVGEASADATRSLLQALALRLVTATRPGTVRLALADPIGEGKHLSAFLRLPAPLRVGNGVASSAAEIESLLKALTDHVVEVTQTRLTNVYESVEAYNAATSGVSVPYHVLIMSDVPAGMTERAGELMTRLLRNGPRAGVYLIASLEPEHDEPRGFNLVGLASTATNVRLTSDVSLSWDDPGFGQWEVEPDRMPPAARANPWLDAVGAVGGTAYDIVPFARIAVRPDARWKGSSIDGLNVQLGVDSKGEPRQFVIGTSAVHHGLVGGSTQMGKTNLLHVLISQLALRYPPEELELYLLDFKEVEFDAYLTDRLPHARAITSRTDREFGLSLLRSFHDEIDRRARLCRDAKVTSLRDYRRETGQALARALVVMDEFQVLFAEEDRLSREAGAQLADIAKRGAAFGLHLLLATQSPGGSLAAHLRPVYEQMALRIALGCTSAAVSQAILGDGNDKATQLTRAGDAIYSDGGGEGANPVMRIAALPTRERLELIPIIRALAGDREYPPPASFDPEAQADFGTHPAAASFAASRGRWPPPEAALEAWLGDAVEIKPATTAIFERYMRSNFLIIGDEEHGHGLLLATALSIAVQLSPADVSFTVAEFARPSSPYHTVFGLLKDLPHEVQIAGARAAGTALTDLIAGLDARLADQEGPASGPERLLLIAGLHRWQDLLAEGDWGKPSETASLLTRLADQGPEVGIHVVAWTDSYASAERALRRAGIGHFGLRAVLRVGSPVESDSLLGVPAAASLGDDRALYRDTAWPSEQVEKFKPYSLTSLRAFARIAFGSPS